MSKEIHHPASFRDPSGFVFEFEGKFYRQVNQCYADNYQLLHTSGLFSSLTKSGRLITHEELTANIHQSGKGYLTLLPEQLTCISYPYEWCFDQLKDAALLTLDILKVSIDHGMILKDATPFNIQFRGTKLVFIDTLSFEKYDDTKPWVAYRQFIECFALPLLLASYRSPELIRMLQLYPDGIPLHIASRLLPFRSKFNFNVLLHVFLAAKLNTRQSNNTVNRQNFSKQKLNNIINSLYTLISRLELKRTKSVWNNYYTDTVLGNEYVDQKKCIISDWLQFVHGNSVLDIGTNTGLFALEACSKFSMVTAIDSDSLCVNDLYRKAKNAGNNNLLPLCVDITMPSPAIGWNNKERSDFFSRYRADVVYALALIHHLAISKNIPLPSIAAKFSQICRFLIIEFVPKDDPKVVLMLASREDIFEAYSETSFEEAFSEFFEIKRKTIVGSTDRVLYLMNKR